MNPQNKNKLIFVTAQVAAKPEFIEKVKAACIYLAEFARLETGCVFYDLFQTEEQSNVFIFFESWKTAKDLENHLASKHAAEFDDAIAGLLLEDEQIVRLKKINGDRFSKRKNQRKTVFPKGDDAIRFGI